ncbi:hypothetical protein ACTWKB_15810 [Bacillus sp. 4A_MP2]
MTTDTAAFDLIGVEPVERLLFSSMEQASADDIHEILRETKETVDQLFHRLFNIKKTAEASRTVTDC